MRSSSALLLAICLHPAIGQTSKQSPSPEAGELLRTGIEAQQHGDMNTAIAEYRKALAMQPDLAEARANLGAALSAIGDFDAAIAEDKRALQSAPDKAAVRMNLGLAYFKKGDFPNARPEFEAVHAARPQDAASAVLLGYTELKLGSAAQAVALLTPLEPGHESNSDLEFVLASALMQAGNENEGLPRMEKVARATNSADSWMMAGSARLHRREFQEARVDLDTALQLDPSIPGLYTLAGQARDALGDTDAAAQAFREALKADPKDFNANLYLGAMHLKQRDLEGARPLLEVALELQPQMPQARLQMAKLDAMQGKNAEAAAALEQLEKADPNWLDPHVELAPIYYKLHRPEDGQRERDIVQRMEASQQKAGPPKQ